MFHRGSIALAYTVVPRTSARVRTSARKWIRAHTVSRDGQPCINFGIPGRPILIPRVAKFGYLGVQVSYGSFEMQTFLSRQQAASSNRARLAKLLHSVSLYMSCVRSSLIFGLHATGLTDAVLRKLSATDSRHLRAIARSPAHITHESTAELRRRLRVVSPEMALVALLRRRIRACTDPASVADMEQQLKWLTHLTEPTVPGQAGSHCRLVPCSVSIGVACPTCGQYTKQHGPRPERAPTPKSTQYTAHTVDGLPQCRHCLSRFTRAESTAKTSSRGMSSFTRWASAYDFSCGGLLPLLQTCRELQIRRDRLGIRAGSRR